jgi:hypothetical protein
VLPASAAVRKLRLHFGAMGKDQIPGGKQSESRFQNNSSTGRAADGDP